MSSAIEACLNKLYLDVTNRPDPTVRDLVEEITELLGSAVIQDHAEACQILKACLNNVSHQNGLDLLSSQQRRFYNICPNLLDQQGGYNSNCVSLLKEIPQLESHPEEPEVVLLRKRLNSYMAMRPSSFFNSVFAAGRGKNSIPTGWLLPKTTHVMLTLMGHSNPRSSNQSQPIQARVLVKNSANYQNCVYLQFLPNDNSSFMSECFWFELDSEKSIILDTEARFIREFRLSMVGYKVAE